MATRRAAGPAEPRPRVRRPGRLGTEGCAKPAALVFCPAAFKREGVRAFQAVAVAMALSGCLHYGASSVYGPVEGGADGGGGDAGPSWSLRITAQPAEGPAPLHVAFALDAGNAPPATPWSIDYGDGTPPGAAHGSHAVVDHAYAKLGSHQAFITVGAGQAALKTSLTTHVLPPDPPAHPDEEVRAQRAPADTPPGHGHPSRRSTPPPAPASSSSSPTGRSA